MNEPVARRPGRLAGKLKPREAMIEAVGEISLNEVSNEALSNRPPMHPPLRADDPRSRAAKRAAEIRGNVGSMDEGVDDFYIDTREIPDGWTYEWKRRTIAGQEDPAYQVSLARMGWEPVPADRHPYMMPVKGQYTTIERKGMMLMERPMELSEEARSIELRRARQQIANKKSQLGSSPDGQFGRDHASVKPKVSNSYEPMPIPND
jgi:hypothetical protein